MSSCSLHTYPVFFWKIIQPPEDSGKVGSFASLDRRGKPTNAEFIRLQYGIIELSVKDIKTY
ncbi:hypothetical protein, partial [Nostoc commune]|uniref:hypothetical protein n=1 Tax=Nostoc commune TaxID=1178 RepID=UPI001E542940